MKNLIYGLLFGLLWSCDKTPKVEDKPLENPVKSIACPAFNQDSAYAYIEKQVNFGPRVPNSEAHKKCGKYFVDAFKSMGWEVIEQDFTAKAWDGTELKSKNVIAVYNPNAEKRILLGAHWDTRPYADQEDDKSLHHKPIDGANDGASGVGVLMEIARSIQKSSQKPNIGIDIILFDSEDYGTPDFEDSNQEAEYWCLGSQYWSTHRHTIGYSAYYGILLDMVGAKDATFAKEGLSMQAAESVVNKVWQKGQGLGYGKYFVDKTVGGITDDHAFVIKNTGIKMIDIIQYNNESQFFGEYWHTHDDNIKVIDKQTLKAVGQTVLEVLYSE
jgi:hypothetical protein